MWSVIILKIQYAKHKITICAAKGISIQEYNNLGKHHLVYSLRLQLSRVNVPGPHNVLNLKKLLKLMEGGTKKKR